MLTFCQLLANTPGVYVPSTRLPYSRQGPLLSMLNTLRRRRKQRTRPQLRNSKSPLIHSHHQPLQPKSLGTRNPNPRPNPVHAAGDPGDGHVFGLDLSRTLARPSRDCHTTNPTCQGRPVRANDHSFLRRDINSPPPPIAKRLRLVW